MTRRLSKLENSPGPFGGIRATPELKKEANAETLRWPQPEATEAGTRNKNFLRKICRVRYTKDGIPIVRGCSEVGAVAPSTTHSQITLLLKKKEERREGKGGGGTFYPSLSLRWQQAVILYFSAGVPVGSSSSQGMGEEPCPKNVAV